MSESTVETPVDLDPPNHVMEHEPAYAAEPIEDITPAPEPYVYLVPGKALAQGLKLLKDAPPAFRFVEISRATVQGQWEAQRLVATDNQVGIRVDVPWPEDVPNINGASYITASQDAPVLIPVDHARKLPIKTTGPVAVSGREQAPESVDLFDDHQVRLGVSAGQEAHAEVCISSPEASGFPDVRGVMQGAIDQASEVGELPLEHLAKIVDALKAMCKDTRWPLVRLHRGPQALVLEVPRQEGDIVAMATIRSLAEAAQEQAQAPAPAEEDPGDDAPASAKPKGNPWSYRLIVMPPEPQEPEEVPAYQSTMPGQ